MRTLAWAACEGPRSLHVARNLSHHPEEPGPPSWVVLEPAPRGLAGTAFKGAAAFGGAAAVVPQEAARTLAKMAPAPNTRGVLTPPPRDRPRSLKCVSSTWSTGRVLSRRGGRQS